MKLKTLALLATLSLAACSPTRETNGVFLSQDDVAKLTPGATRETVLQTLGTPTSTSMFDENTWYYAGQQTEKKAFLDPKVTARSVVEVKFAEDGTMTSMRSVDANDAVDVPIVRRTTPTSGHDMTVAQQLLGNLGRFNKKKSGTPGEI